tara:strand:+ start:95 stop:277 length:183 start_codon:yes stop_codon:yes gene_type:complete
MIVSLDQIKLAAQELIDLHGDDTVDVATERVELLKRTGDSPDLDTALLVLSEVEKLTGSR